jgi:hypothetical protein
MCDFAKSVGCVLPGLLLSMVLSSVGITAAAQDVTISSVTTTVYTIPDNKAVGLYTYVRQTMSVDCIDWQSSNEFVV